MRLLGFLGVRCCHCMAGYGCGLDGFGFGFGTEPGWYWASGAASPSGSTDVNIDRRAGLLCSAQAITSAIGHALIHSQAQEVKLLLQQ